MTNTIKTPTNVELIIVSLPRFAKKIRIEDNMLKYTLTGSSERLVHRSYGMIIQYKDKEYICQIKDLTNQQCEEWGYDSYIPYSAKERFTRDLDIKGIQYNENTLIIEKICL